MSFAAPEPSYDAVPYPGRAYALSHPDRLAVIGHLFGLDTPRPSGARILEIGCAGGANLLPLAAHYPDARFVGLDTSAGQIATARAAAAPFANVELREAGIAEVDASWGPFDYIIAHGVWSWVSPADRERIFAVIRERLAPLGVAYVSYNVLPGWHLHGIVRDMMRYHAAAQPDPAAGLAEARRFLDLLVESHGEVAQQSPYAAMLKARAARIARHDDAYLWHDHLSAHNEAVYFTVFAEAAAAQGLDYLGESPLSAMLAHRLPPAYRRFLETVDGVLRTEQYMDFFTGRTFRSSLLVHREAPVRRAVGSSGVLPLHAACDGEVTGTRLQRARTAVELARPGVAEAVDRLCRAWPETVPVAALVRTVQAEAGTPEGGRVAGEVVAHTLLSLYAADQVELWRDPCPASASPGLSPWVRGELEAGRSEVTNTRHHTVRVDADLAETLLQDRTPPDEGARRLSLWMRPGRADS